MHHPFTFAIALTVSASFAAASVIDFDVAADLDDFSESGVTGGSQFVHSTSPGVDGAAGRVNTNMPGGGDNESITYDAESFDFAADQPITLTTSFLFGGSALSNTRFGVGLTDDTGANGASYYSLDTALVHIRLQASDSDTFFFRSQQFFGDGSTFENGPDGDSVDLAIGQWYTLAATFTPFENTPADNTFTFDASLTRVSDDTTLGGLTGSFSTANPTLANDTTVYGGVRIDAPAGIDAFDNFTIPEPATAGLLGLAGLALLRRRQRV